ncbi:Zinc finger, CCHC-type, partial [Parasponia andersonii]
MKSGESVTDFFARTMTIANKMRIHGERMEDVTIIEKILRSMTPKFNFIVCSIEESKDIDALSIDELQSSLLVHEQKINQQEKEEQALKASTENHLTPKGDRGQGRGRGRGRGSNDRGNQQQHHQHQDNQFQGRGRGRSGHHSTSHRPKSADKSNVECYRCHRYGHYKSECRTNLNRQNGERTNFAEKEEEVSLLMVCHVNEETQQNIWYLDTGCSNHMCGDKKAFSELDDSFRNTVKFGDNSTVSVMGKGRITLQTKENSTHTISNVLFVPDLKTNLLSVGQLQEKGYEISIKD